MADPETIADAISVVATGPKRTKVKNTEVEEHDLDQLIKADNHVAAKTAGTRNHQGMRFNQIVPPGAG